MINWLLIVAILVWPFGQLLQVNPLGGFLRLQLLDLVSVALFISLFVSQKNRRLVFATPLFRPLLYFTLAAALSLVMSAFRLDRVQMLVGLAYYFRFVSYTSYYFVFRLQGIKKYLRFFVLSALIFLLLGFAQYIYLPDMRFLRYLGFDDHYYRLVSSLFDPNYAGLILTIFTLLALSFPQTRFLSLVSLFALVLTFSRASFLALATGLIFLGLAKKKFSLLISLLILGIILYFVPKPFGEGVNLARTFSITSRIDNQVAALKLFSQKPLFGWGFDTLKQTGDILIPSLTSGVDNSYLFVLATTGLIGFVTFIDFLSKAWASTKLSVIRAAILAIMVHSLFNNSFFYIYILPLFFLLAATKSTKSASL